MHSVENLPRVVAIFETNGAVYHYKNGSPSKLLCGFRKGYSTRQALVRFLEKTKLCLDVGGKVGAIMMDLSKAFDCLRYDLPIAKSHAYSFSYDSLPLI